MDGYSFNKSQQRTNFNERLPEQWVLHSGSWIRGPLHMSALALSAYSKAPKARTTEPTTGVATATPSAISIQYQWATEELEQGKARWKVCESESGLKRTKKKGNRQGRKPTALRSLLINSLAGLLTGSERPKGHNKCLTFRGQKSASRHRKKIIIKVNPNYNTKY